MPPAGPAKHVSVRVLAGAVAAELSMERASRLLWGDPAGPALPEDAAGAALDVLARRLGCRLIQAPGRPIPPLPPRWSAIQNDAWEGEGLGGSDVTVIRLAAELLAELKPARAGGGLWGEIAAAVAAGAIARCTGAWIADDPEVPVPVPAPGRPAVADESRVGSWTAFRMRTAQGLAGEFAAALRADWGRRPRHPLYRRLTHDAVEVSAAALAAALDRNTGWALVNDSEAPAEPLAPEKPGAVPTQEPALIPTPTGLLTVRQAAASVRGALETGAGARKFEGLSRNTMDAIMDLLARVLVRHAGCVIVGARGTR